MCEQSLFRRWLRTVGVAGLLMLASPLWGQAGSETDIADAVRQLTEALQRGDLQERRDAAWALIEFGPAAAPALPALAAATADRDPQVANGALQALGRIGPAAAAAVPEIFAQLGSRDAQRRYRAVFAMGHAAAADNPLFLEGLRDPSANLRAATAEAVGWMQRPSAALIDEVSKRLDDESQEVVTAATAALQSLGSAAVPALCRSLQAESAAAQQRAAATLALIGPAGAAAAPRLIELCASDDPAVRAAAISAVGKVATQDPAAQAAIFRALEDSEPSVVTAAITAVIHVGPQAAPAIPQLIAKVDASPEVADLAAVALGRLGVAALPAVPQILQRMNPTNQAAIVNTISGLGPAAIPAILQSTADNSLSVPQAAEIIGRMGPRAASALSPAWESSQPTDRAVAARALGQVRRDAETADQLMGLLNDNSASVRAAAASGLAQLGPLAKRAQSQLQQIMQDPDAEVRGQCLTALVALGVPSEQIAPALLVGLRDTAPEVRRQAAVAVGNLENISPEVITALTEALGDADTLVRQKATETLGRDAQTAQAATDVLAAALKDPDEAVSLAAALALQRVDELPPSVVDGLIEVLDHPSVAVRAAAITALAAGDEAARRAQSRLSDFRLDPSASLRIAAIRTLAALAKDDAQRLEVLMAGLEDADWTVRRGATEALGELGERATAAVPRLLQRMTDPQDGETVTAALRRIDAAPAEAVPMLVEILENDKSDRRQRYYAIHLLRKVGPAAQSVLPALREIRDQSDGRIREFLDRAIEEIQP